MLATHKYAAVFTCVSLAVVGSVTLSSANENVVGRPPAGGSPVDTSGPQAQHDRNLTRDQLSPNIRTLEGVPSDLEQAGTGNHPFTTQGASAEGNIEPTTRFPWSASGKLFMEHDSNTFVCTASVVAKSVLVTAAHCVHNFGQQEAGFPKAVSFEPARHGAERPFGTWTAKEWWVPKAYFDGTDVCSAEAPDVVCENDVAVVVMEPSDGKMIGDVVGKYSLPPEPTKDHEFGYFIFAGQKIAQLTQIGYPARFYDGVKMIRTDSFGYQDAPNNVVIGSNQTGGSSGGPWLNNFGSTTSFTGEAGSDIQINTVSAVTSWGFNDGAVKIQGASRFGKNTTYTIKSNIHSLMDSACGANPGAC